MVFYSWTVVVLNEKQDNSDFSLMIWKVPIMFINYCHLCFQSLRLSITEREMEKEHQKQVQRRRAAKEKQNRPDSKKTNKKRH